MIESVGAAAAADWARSGVVSLTGHGDGSPLVPPGAAATLAGRIGDWLAAATAASGHPVRLDGAALLAERAALCGFRRRGRLSAGGATRLLPTCEGWAAVSCARRDDVALLGALVGAELADDPWPGVAAWLRTHTGAELAERAALLGLAATPVAGPAAPAARTVAGIGACAADGAAVLEDSEIVGDGGAVVDDFKSPEGLLVVDFSALWAGPLCAHLLGLAGARVVKVETPQRPDGARRGNRAFYDLLHAGHRSVVLDPAVPEGRRALAALVAAADIVIEASRPRALAGFGLDAQAAADEGTVWVSITAAGRGSPRVGFGDDVAAGAGLVAYDDHGQPVFCGDALADPLTGLVAAKLAMAAVSSGHGRLLDIAMSAVVAATLPTPAGTALADPFRSPAARSEGEMARSEGELARSERERWLLDAPCGPVRVAAPRARTPSGRAPAPGEHTGEILRELRPPARPAGQ